MSGKLVWEKRLTGSKGTNWSSVMIAEGLCYTISQGGDCFVFRASPEFELVATNSLGEPSNSSVAQVMANCLSALTSICGALAPRRQSKQTFSEVVGNEGRKTVCCFGYFVRISAIARGNRASTKRTDTCSNTDNQPDQRHPQLQRLNESKCLVDGRSLS